jgi:hypothetical protein
MAVSSRITSFFTLMWQWLPGASRGAKVIWLWHLFAVLALWYLLRHWKTPSGWESDVFTPKPNPFKQCLQYGIYRGAIVHLIISGICLLSVKWWGQKDCVLKETKLSVVDAGKQGWWFWPLILVIVIAAGVMRWPRMDHSYWGDEGWAVRHYVHGEWEPRRDHDYQGELVFEQVPWQRVIFSDLTGGNHFLFSIAQRLMLDAWRAVKGLPPWAFDETVSRLPVLAAGLGSIVALALFLRWMGRPLAGLMGALFFALHPWHIRYSTEGRGYIMMALFMVLAVWALMWALRDGRWRAWMTFGAMQFLAIYSWKIAALPLAEISALTALLILVSKRDSWRSRATTVGRVFVVGATMSAFFGFLYSTPSLQAPRALERLKHTGKPMDHRWFYNSLTGLLVGTPWYRASVENPTEVPLKEAVAKSPIKTLSGISAALLLLGIGVARLWRTRPWQLVLWVAIIGGAVVGASLFKWVIGIEWIFWYSFFVIVPLAVLHAIGAEWLLGKGLFWMTQKPARAAMLLSVGPLLPCMAYGVAVPQIELMDTQPYESNREAFYFTRGKHEPWNYDGPSKIKTCYLWRHIYLYDPRADTHVRDAATLRSLMKQADEIDGEFYYVVGQRLLFRELQKEVMAILSDTALFEKTHVLWAEEEIHTLEIYRYKKRAALR